MQSVLSLVVFPVVPCVFYSFAVTIGLLCRVQAYIQTYIFVFK